MNVLDNTVFVFPAKGALYPNVCRDYYRKYPRVKEYFQQAGECSQFDYAEYLFSDESDFHLPVFSELATLLVSISKHYAWSMETGLWPELFSGLSMGLYSALIAAGALAMEDGFRLLQFTMESGLRIPGKMALITGLPASEVQTICSKPELIGKVVIANHNTEHQIVVSGDEYAVDLALKHASDAYAHECRVLYKGQFHAPAFRQQANELMEMMLKMKVKNPVIPVLFPYNLQKAATRKESCGFLSDQLCMPVRWYETVQWISSKGYRRIVEFGPGNMMCKIISSIDKKLSCFSVEGIGHLASLGQEFALGEASR